MWVSPAQSVLTVTPVMVVVVEEPEPVKKASESHFIAKTSSFFIAKTSKDAEYAKIDLTDIFFLLRKHRKMRNTRK